MASVQVRYIVNDVGDAIEFYTQELGFKLWNRFAIQVQDLAATVERLRAAGAHFRNEIVTGVGGKQTIVDDPSGNPVELFEPTIAEAQMKQ